MCVQEKCHYNQLVNCQIAGFVEMNRSQVVCFLYLFQSLTLAEGEVVSICVEVEVMSFRSVNLGAGEQ